MPSNKELLRALPYNYRAAWNQLHISKADRFFHIAHAYGRLSALYADKTEFNPLQVLSHALEDGSTPSETTTSSSGVDKIIGKKSRFLALGHKIFIYDTQLEIDGQQVTYFTIEHFSPNLNPLNLFRRNPVRGPEYSAGIKKVGTDGVWEASSSTERVQALYQKTSSLHVIRNTTTLISSSLP